MLCNKCLIICSLINAWFFTVSFRLWDKNYVWNRHKSIVKLVWQIIFILIFVTNYSIFSQLFMNIIFGYPLIGQFDRIWQALKTYFLLYAWYFTFIYIYIYILYIYTYIYIYTHTHTHTIAFAIGHFKQATQIIGK